MDARVKILVDEINEGLKAALAPYIGKPVNSVARELFASMMAALPGSALPNSAVIPHLKFKWTEGATLCPVDFYTALIMFLTRYACPSERLPLPAEVPGSTYTISGIAILSWDAEKETLLLKSLKPMDTIHIEFTVTEHGAVKKTEPVMSKPLQVDPNPITYRQMHEAAAGMGLEKIYFTVNNIDPDAVVRCNCNWDGGHEPHCDIAQAHDLCRMPQHRD